MWTSRVLVSPKYSTPQPSDSRIWRVTSLPGRSMNASSRANSLGGSSMRRPRTYLVALGVHLDGADNQVARFALVDGHAGPPELRPDPRDQLPHGERLGDIVVRPDLQARHLVGLGVLGGQDDDRDLGLPPDDPAQVEPVDVRQHEVEDHQHGAPLPEQIETPEPVQCG